MLTLYLDESGDDGLVKINPQYPFFGIGGTIFDQAQYVTSEDQKVKDFKKSVFGTDSIILRSYDIMKKQGRFACLNNPNTLQQFYEEYTNLTHNLDYSFISWIINKPAHCAKYEKPYPADEWVLELIMQSYSKILHRKRTQGNIVMESRDKKQDAKMNQAFNLLMENGLRFITAAQLNATITGIRFEKKSQNINGLQLSDLSIYTATIAVLKNAFQRRDFVLLKTKFDPYHGLRIFP